MLINAGVSYSSFSSWADFKFKEAGNYLFIDEFSHYSFEYEKEVGGGQPDDYYVVYYAILYGIMNEIIGCWIWFGFSVCILCGMQKINERNRDFFIMNEMIKAKPDYLR